MLEHNEPGDLTFSTLHVQANTAHLRVRSLEFHLESSVKNVFSTSAIICNSQDTPRRRGSIVEAIKEYE
jgi:hypothetical protein